MKEYLIVIEGTVVLLMDSVNDEVRNGYEPCGGITFIPRSEQKYDDRYIQAMFKSEPEAL